MFFLTLINFNLIIIIRKLCYEVSFCHHVLRFWQGVASIICATLIFRIKIKMEIETMILNVDKLSKNFGFGSLFENLSFSLNEGEILSILGANGCGKSTLLKMIMGIERIDKGTINIKKGAKVAYLNQTGSSINDNRNVREVLEDAFIELNEMKKRLYDLEKLLENHLNDEKYQLNLQRYCKLVERFSFEGGYDIDYNINTVIEGLKIDRNLLHQSYNDLSGGEKTLIQLAKSLLIKPDLFLLDEPTNHLDIERIEWLEKYLKSFKGAILMVSHDRYFLDKMSNKILYLDQGKAKIYFGGYSNFIQESKKDFEKQMVDYKNQQTAIKRLEEQIKYFAEMGMAKNSSTLCDRAHTLQTQLNRIKKNMVNKPKKQKYFDLDFEEEKKTSKRIIEAKDFSIELSNQRLILNNINLSICAGERVALIGKNGSGKSSFIKAVVGNQNLKMSGKLIVGPSVKIGYLPQIIRFPSDDMTLLNYFMEETNLPEKEARQILASFEFYKIDVDKRAKDLSGGEKIRVKLAILLQLKVNTLIFDEPTNHIDIPTKEMLEKSLEDFGGTLIFVSHDRYFINKFAQKTIEFACGKATIYNGNYDYYKEMKTLKNKT